MKLETKRRKLMRQHRSFTALAGLLAVLLGGSVAHAAPGDTPGKAMPPVTNAPDQPAGTFEYLWLAGSTFHPFGDGAEFAYAGSGCINATGGTEKRLLHKVILPAGATVNYVRLYAYDDSIGSITAFFTTYDAAGNYTQLSTVTSSDAGGFVSDLSSPINYVVDQFTAPINIVVNLGSDQSADTIFKNGFDSGAASLRFCAARIAYTP